MLCALKCTAAPLKPQELEFEAQQGQYERQLAIMQVRASLLRSKGSKGGSLASLNARHTGLDWAGLGWAVKKTPHRPT